MSRVPGAENSVWCGRAPFGAFSYWSLIPHPGLGREVFVLVENNTENEEDVPSQALEVAAVEETLPEEIAKVDHSQLYVWVADSGNDRIQKFDGNGKLLMSFGTSGSTRPDRKSVV